MKLSGKEALLLSAVFVLPVVFMSRKSATVDEVSHLPAGYSYLRTGRVILNPMHPPLIKEICALPLLLLHTRMPADEKTIEKLGSDVTYQREFGERFFLTQDADRLLFWGRVPAVLLSVGLAVVVMVWARELWGRTAGLFALFLYAFDPTITAHAQLVTTDVGLAFFATLFLYSLRKYIAAPSWKRLGACGILLGFALGAKFSAVLLIPMAVFLLALATRASHKKGARKALTAGSVAAASVAIVATASLVLWAIYLFPNDPLFYLRAIATLDRDLDPNYLHLLMGELKPGGWLGYLSIAWLIKTPIPFLLILAMACFRFARGCRASSLEEAFLIVPLLGFFAGYSFRAIPIGVRYLIPVFPFLFVFAARVMTEKTILRTRAAVTVAALLVWSVVEYVSISPDHLSYFNEIAGGSRGGIEWLDDSNVDWGQGLIQLRDYLRAQPVESFRFCYFGTFEPGYYGIHGERIDINALLSPPAAGTLILSAHCVGRAQAALTRRYGSDVRNWLAHTNPTAIVGHAYYVYAIG